MKKVLLLSCILLIIITSCKEKDTKQELKRDKETTPEIHFFTSDSIKIYGDLYTKDKSAPTLLIFHQGGSNVGAEYKTIIPKLVNDGFNILAIDQRVGGQYYYGGHNRTVAAISKNEYNYCDAYPDLEAALEYINTSGFTGDKILWGSSYSATLAIKLANNNQDVINGVLAFSPASGKAMEGCNPDPYFESLKLPLLLLKPASEMKSERSKNQLKLAEQFGHKTYIAKNGVHGSSMLVESRIEGSADETWSRVNTFLEQFK